MKKKAIIILLILICIFGTGKAEQEERCTEEYVKIGENLCECKTESGKRQDNIETILWEKKEPPKEEKQFTTIPTSPKDNSEIKIRITHNQCRETDCGICFDIIYSEIRNTECLEHNLTEEGNLQQIIIAEARKNIERTIREIS